MANIATKSSEKTKTPTRAKTPPPAKAPTAEWHPFESLRREVDKLFDDFNIGVFRAPFQRPMWDIEPFWRQKQVWESAPAVDVAETDAAFEVTAELPGMDEKNVDVTVVNGSLKITGEKKEESEKKEKDYYLKERSFGSFERCFAIPENVNADEIDASFKKGVLKVTLPKKPNAITKERKITVKHS